MTVGTFLPQTDNKNGYLFVVRMCLSLVPQQLTPSPTFTPTSTQGQRGVQFSKLPQAGNIAPHHRAASRYSKSHPFHHSVAGCRWQGPPLLRLLQGGRPGQPDGDIQGQEGLHTLLPKRWHYGDYRDEGRQQWDRWWR